jgi:hypothetical protein
METQMALALPVGTTPLTRREEALVFGGINPLLIGALEFVGAVGALVILAVIAGGVVYALTH